MGVVLAEPIVDEETGEIIVAEGTKISDAELDQIEASGIYNEQGLRSVKISFRDQELNLMFTTGIPEKLILLL